MTAIKLLGFPRSGTSLLQRLLATHPEIYAPPETYLFSGCARMMRESSGEGPDLGMLTGLQFSGFDEADILDRIRRFAFSFLEEAAEKAGKPTWAEKSAFDIFDLSEIEELLAGHCKFVCVVRHPLDVISSMKELTDQMGQNVPEMRPWMAVHDNFYLAWAAAWRDLTTGLLAMKARLGDDAILCRYEDLVTAPKETLTQITRLAGVADYIGTAQPNTTQIGLGDWKVFETTEVSQKSVSRWRRSLPRSSAKAAIEIVSPLMADLGYEVPRVSAPANRAQRIRQYKIAKALTISAVNKTDTA
jgi:protein-tyrosine sulfotransferase